MKARRVLAVEDDADSREALRVLLAAFGHEVRVAADGEAAVAQDVAFRPDVAVVDVGLPRMDGYEVAELLRAVLGGSALLIAHTAYGRPADLERGRRAGFDAYLTKPGDPLELAALVGGGADEEP